MSFPPPSPALSLPFLSPLHPPPPPLPFAAANPFLFFFGGPGLAVFSCSFVPGCHPNVVDYVSCSLDTLAIVMVAESCDLQELLSYKLPLESMGRGETMR